MLSWNRVGPWWFLPQFYPNRGCSKLLPNIFLNQRGRVCLFLPFCCFNDLFWFEVFSGFGVFGRLLTNIFCLPDRLIYLSRIDQATLCIRQPVKVIEFCSSSPRVSVQPTMHDIISNYAAMASTSQSFWNIFYSINSYLLSFFCWFEKSKVKYCSIIPPFIS